MKIEVDPNKLVNENGEYDQEKLRSIEKLTGRSFDAIRNESIEAGMRDQYGREITTKEQVKDPQARARYFNALRLAGKKPKEEFDKLD